MPSGYRRCVSCRRTAHRQEFWRIVRLFGSQQIQLEIGQGRSAYLCKGQACLQEAKKHRRLERSLKTSIPQLIFDRLNDQLRENSIRDP